MKFSASYWVQRAGVGGQLAPFFKCVCVYFALCAEVAAPGARVVAVKCAPVLCLLAAVLYRAASLPPHRRRYPALVGCALALSAVGDAVLVWPALTAAGLLVFAAAHAAYIAALGLRPARAGAAVGALTAAAAAAYLWAVRPRGVEGALAAPYAALLAGTAWRAAARGGAAAAGAGLLLLSDALLGWELWAGPLPLRHLLVMPAYYGGQLAMAYSALTDTPQGAEKAQ